VIYIILGGALREPGPSDNDPFDAAFAGIGALLMLMIFHYDLSVIALIGIILLIGIVRRTASCSSTSRSRPSATRG